jgi:methyl-accepting chemotaxis protein
LEETAGAVVQISNAIKDSAQNAASARDFVGDANKDAEASSATVEHAVKAMTEIATSSREIGQIIGVIDEIAFQTSLLALNAGVEAARAGEAGRGFAVVATEVRALAQRSADAAKQIRELISMSSGQVTHGVSLVGEAGNALQRIMTRVTEINGLVADISSRANEQSMALTQVSTTVTQMDNATQQNAAMVEETTAATRNLSEESQRLLALVAKFQLGQSNGSRDLSRSLAAAAPHVRELLQKRRV